MTRLRASSSASRTRILADHAGLALVASGAGVVVCLLRPDPGVAAVAALGSAMLVFTAVERALDRQRQVGRAAVLASMALLGVALRTPLARIAEPLFALTALSAVSIMVGVFEVSRLLADRKSERLATSSGQPDVGQAGIEPEVQPDVERAAQTRRITLREDGGAESSQDGVTVVYEPSSAPTGTSLSMPGVAASMQEATTAPGATEMADTTS